VTFEIKTVADWMGHLLYLPRCARCGIALERSDRVREAPGGTGYWCMTCTRTER